MHPYDALLQAKVSGLQGEDRQEVAVVEQEPLTLDPLPQGEREHTSGSSHQSESVLSAVVSNETSAQSPFGEGGIARAESNKEGQG